LVEEKTMGWRWTARRLLISAFLVFHLSATLIWISPNCPIKEALFQGVRYYMLPLGLWQGWAMFAPDPAGEALALEAEVIDAKGMRHVYPFVHLSQCSWWEALPRFRHFKFAYNLLGEEYVQAREYTARYAVRQLNLKAEAFPLQVNLYYDVMSPPANGETVRDPMQLPSIAMLGTYQFERESEVRP
jgi:hypothetical protein